MEKIFQIRNCIEILANDINICSTVNKGWMDVWMVRV